MFCKEGYDWSLNDVPSQSFWNIIDTLIVLIGTQGIDLSDHTLIS